MVVLVHAAIATTAVPTNQPTGAGCRYAGDVPLIRLFSAASAGPKMIRIIVSIPPAPVMRQRVAIVAIARIAIGLRITGRGDGSGVRYLIGFFFR